MSVVTLKIVVAVPAALFVAVTTGLLVEVEPVVQLYGVGVWYGVGAVSSPEPPVIELPARLGKLTFWIPDSGSLVVASIVKVPALAPFVLM
jgi:hypothetical protein